MGYGYAQIQEAYLHSRDDRASASHIRQILVPIVSEIGDRHPNQIGLDVADTTPTIAPTVAGEGIVCLVEFAFADPADCHKNAHSSLMQPVGRHNRMAVGLARPTTLDGSDMAARPNCEGAHDNHKQEHAAAVTTLFLPVCRVSRE
jgi:hypothetical protein